MQPIEEVSQDTMAFVVAPGGALRGRLRVPGDKSISHRAIILGALAEGITQITGFLEGEDTLATLQAFRDLGVSIEGPEGGRVKIHGVSLQGLRAPEKPLYLGNSGTSVRLLAGLFAGQSFDVILRGDESLSRRPMRRVCDPLARMGAFIETTAQGTPPLHIHGGQSLYGIEYAMPMASAQVKSSLLLAGLYASGRTCVVEPAPTRDHSERMLAGFGYPVEREGAKVCIQGGGTLHGTVVEIPADISSAAFFMVGAAIGKGSDILLEHVGINPTRTGIIDILRRMGAEIEIRETGVVGGEPVAAIRVRASRLHGINIPEDLVPLAIDEFPALFIAAACAEGETVLAGAGELRVKESDRIQVMADGLQALGISAQPTADGIIIQGGELQGGEVHSHGDHRCAMAFAMASLVAKGPIIIRDCANVATSFPGFLELACGAGLAIRHGK
ncbi:3-phosphoshikimate 1-carboxyvinyltransferase [Nitrosococcus oceani ATCC 19707]|uniref:3-phosphoshikimate 1-carboxyvinyltransferase n=2 Tax=Nitrosococcus oceani TaxID=1229 RepID=AROA_NITOC|nr:3-phosphoshikimate 1-carboxyvinyltransferase [Nitrosococcus oceani]Q3JEN6.1 RecName: Full=3-phosphoshikimate 1-carboxyvinyltransferase; AltName: Full=5-enolpyruvylshikimate-3-phosphate synthase; Short=EPSP synthase; Short=EPSPS [Nitrosococcus oceani ATCC 19707]KFI20845.1 3-phosphoshikimate 1-carboxyvinyltransferase [Nitrosococcus oceani C-27]ABA56710.1 3-phosphoshikimate 1-carboxyvinyltransferase [Nitrosococcus oceani ATCC 19707]EDZ65848.1 3-phosphoshikimate 1-carboxyvinyltransferase [Nitros